MTTNQLVNVGDIIAVPKTVCESGYIKIVAYDPTTSHHPSWDYKAHFYDPTTPNRYFPLFEVKTEELQRWLNNGDG